MIKNGRHTRFMLLILFLAGFVFAATGCDTVDGDDSRDAMEILVPEDFETIQEAIEASRDGDVIIVSPGTYEGFDFIHKRVTVRSTNPDCPDTVAATVIKGEVSAKRHEKHETVLKGFTISNPSRFGVYIAGMAEPTITQNVITGCGSHGIFIENSSQWKYPQIINNVIENNQGSGIRMKTTTPIIKDNVITNNHAPETGAVWSESAHGTFTGNVITDNLGSAIYFQGFSSGVVVGNVFENNVAADRGGALYVSRPTKIKDLDGNEFNLAPGEVDSLNTYGEGERANQPDDIYFAIWD